MGRALAARLLADGEAVRAIVLPGDRGLDDLVRQFPERLEVVEASIVDAHELSAAFEGVENVFHTAALIHAWAPRSDFEQVNVVGARNVAELSLAHAVRRLIAVSTSDVFGMPADDRPLTEAGPYRPWGEPYADTKIAGEEWLWRLHRESGLPLSVVYPGWVYGPGDRAFFPGLAKAIGAGQMFFWSRNVRLPFAYIDNLVDACLLIAERDEANGQGYIVHDGIDGPTMEELAGAIADEIGARRPKLHLPYGLTLFAARALQGCWRLFRLGGMPPLLSVDVKAFGMQFHLSTDKVRALGWEPQVPVEEGMRRALAALARPGA